MTYAQAVIADLREHGPSSTRDVTVRTKLDPGSIRNTLSALAMSGRITRSARGTYEVPPADPDHRCAGWDLTLLELRRDDGSRWGAAGLYLFNEDGRHPLAQITFCPFCGEKLVGS